MAAPPTYAQDLSRSLTFKENVLITLSSVTPASSVFIIVPAIIAGIGGASAVALALGALVGVFMAFCYAELSSAYPVTGGEYAFAARVLGRPLGFAMFALSMVGNVLIVAVIALGTGDYLGLVWQALSGTWVGVAVVVLATLVAVLNIRANAWLTGLFLLLELLALVVLAVLGFAHVEQPLSVLWTPQTTGPSGLEAASWGLIATYTATALFAYNGYGTAVYFAEETRQAGRTIGRAIMFSLAVTVTAELVPVVAVLLGTPDLAGLLASDAPMSHFLLSRGGRVVDTVVSLAIALAIVNAVIAIMIQAGRLLYSAARDGSWPDVIGRPLARVHPGLRTPVAATLVMGALAVVAAVFVPLDALIIATGANLVVVYAVVALAALVGRARGLTDRAAYRMPLWPLAPVAVLAAMAYVAYETIVSDWVPLGVTVAILGLGLLYYRFYLHPRRGERWTLPDPVPGD
ncbi:APC family permease [Nonomuraea africana]|uniref:Amino acid transporter n=1 Tax=Nonomuraea africana TaxID=46171 RepID=A0ABR9KEH8_9ACTN|nr:APC family permease [Nonomuraea africana]MBE1560405.1 amino acid transporter [Nonomuraea africana]